MNKLLFSPKRLCINIPIVENAWRKVFSAMMMCIYDENTLPTSKGHLRQGVKTAKHVIFRDGCGAQFKSKIPFHLLLDAQTRCCYFGSQHGKSNTEIVQINSEPQAQLKVRRSETEERLVKPSPFKVKRISEPGE